MLGYALLVEGAGVLAFLFAETPFLGYLSTTLLAVGFGAGSISLAVVLARIFGAGVFAQVLGVNYLIAGILQAISPDWPVGRMTSRAVTGLISATLLSMLGALCTYLLRVPRLPGGIESMPG